MLARTWPPGIVPELLARAGTVSTRPANLGSEGGIGKAGYRFSEAQAQAVLDMRLNRLTGLEQDKIVEEFQGLLREIVDLSDILARPERLIEVVRHELIEIRDNYGDARRTQISRDHLNLSTEDLIEPQDVAVTLSHAGSAAAGAANPPRRSRTRTLSRSFSLRIRTIRCCVFPTAAKSTGCACSSCRRPDAARAANPS
jgi:DNA gyrase subunit A